MHLEDNLGSFPMFSLINQYFGFVNIHKIFPEKILSHKN
jgi:hypothetical protein